MEVIDQDNNSSSQMENYDNKFEIASEKMLNFELKNSCWCPNMDLLALLSSENLFELYRIHLKNNKVRSQASSMGEFTAFTFNPEGSYIVLATEKGQFVLVKSELGGDLFNLNLKEHNSAIVHQNWLSYGKNYDWVSFNPLRKDSQLDRFQPVVEPHKNSNKENLLKLNLFKEKIEHFSMLISADSLGMICMTLNGIFGMAEINFAEKINKFQETHYKNPFLVNPYKIQGNGAKTVKSEENLKQKNKLESKKLSSDINIEKTLMNDKNSKLIIINSRFICEDSQQNPQNSKNSSQKPNTNKMSMEELPDKDDKKSRLLTLTELDTSILHYNKDELIKITYVQSYVNTLVESLSLSLNGMYQNLKDVQRVMVQLFQNYEDNLRSDETGIEIKPNEDILQFAKTGNASTAFSSLLAELSEKRLQEIDTKINASFGFMQEIIIESVQSVLERMGVLLDMLYNLTSKEEFGSSSEELGIFGLKKEEIEKCLKCVEGLGERTEEFLFVISETKVRIRNFQVWISRCLNKSKYETELDGDDNKNIQSRYKVDQFLLIKYCKSENSFWFRYLYDYFDNKFEVDVSEYDFDFFRDEQFFVRHELDEVKNARDEVLGKIFKDFQEMESELGIVIDHSNIEGYQNFASTHEQPEEPINQTNKKQSTDIANLKNPLKLKRRKSLQGTSPIFQKSQNQQDLNPVLNQSQPVQCNKMDEEELSEELRNIFKKGSLRKIFDLLKNQCSESKVKISKNVEESIKISKNVNIGMFDYSDSYSISRQYSSEDERFQVQTCSHNDANYLILFKKMIII